MNVRLLLVSIAIASLGSGACASARRDHHLAEMELLQSRIATLDSEKARLSAVRDSMGVQNDSLRRSAARLEADLREREELIRALKLELERLKEIDLRPRPRRPPE
jgi:chromosome segregation ATPase